MVSGVGVVSSGTSPRAGGEGRGESVRLCVWVCWGRCAPGGRGFFGGEWRVFGRGRGPVLGGPGWCGVGPGRGLGGKKTNRVENKCSVDVLLKKCITKNSLTCVKR